MRLARLLVTAVVAALAVLAASTIGSAVWAGPASAADDPVYRAHNFGPAPTASCVTYLDHTDDFPPYRTHYLEDSTNPPGCIGRSFDSYTGAYEPSPGYSITQLPDTEATEGYQRTRITVDGVYQTVSNREHGPWFQGDTQQEFPPYWYEGADGSMQYWYPEGQIDCQNGCIVLNKRYAKPHWVRLAISSATSTDDSRVYRGGFIIVNVGAAAAPTASFTATPRGVDHEVVDFDASASASGDGSPLLSYTWEFGDGSRATSTTPRITHAYATPGAHPVTLTVTASANATGTSTGSVTTDPAITVNSTADKAARNVGTTGCDTGATVTVGGATRPECTLRAAIAAANARTDHSAISFAPASDASIAPLTPLPAIRAAGVKLDGTTNPSGTVTLDGDALASGQADLHVSGGGAIVQGFVLRNATFGVLVDAADGHDVLRANWIGVAPGSASSTHVQIGIKVDNSPSVVIGGPAAADRNVVSQVQVGAFVTGTGSSNATVQSNYFGVDAAGDAVPDGAGVEIVDASGARVGGPTSVAGTAPGNAFGGVTTGVLNNEGSSAIAATGVTTSVTGTTIQGNSVGLDPDGTTPTANHFVWGVLVGGRTSGTMIGGTTSGAGNVLSGSSGVQVSITGTMTSGTQVLGNLIGTDVTGLHYVPGADGVHVDAASTTTVGTPGSGRNVITGTGVYGVLTSATSTPLLPGTIVGSTGHTPAPGTANVTTTKPMSTIISGNVIGPLADGTTVDPERVLRTGVALAGLGETLGPNNQIAYTVNAVNVAHAGETVVGNLIGTNPAGTNALPNGTGVFVSVAHAPTTGVPGVRIGVPGQRPNVIAGNTQDVVLDSPALVQGNLIGTVANGLSPVGAYHGPVEERIGHGAGVTGAMVYTRAAGSVIGGPNPGAGNTISGAPTGNGGLLLLAPATVQGNDIGVGSDGTTPVGNSTYGIGVAASGSVIGAASPGGRGPATGPGGNVIAHNAIGIKLGDKVRATTMLADLVHDNATAAIASIDADYSPAPPSVESAAQDGLGHTAVFVRARANATVQLYRAANCGPSDTSGQGSAVLFTGVADAHGELTITLPVQAVGTDLDATETTVGTSAFSGCVSVAAAAAGAVRAPAPRRGQSETADGSGFDPGESVTATVHSTPVLLGTKTADPNGAVSFTFAVPAGLAGGAHYVLLRGATHSVAVPFTVPAPPSAPLAVRVTGGSGRVSLSWHAPVDTGSSPVASYRVLRSTDRRHWTLRGTGRTTAFADRAVAGGTRYYYEVVASNAVGSSPTSAPVSAVPFTRPGVPGALRAKAGKRRLTVSWSTPAAHGAPVTAYVVSYARCRIGAAGCHPTTRHTGSRSVVISGLSARRRYYVTVAALNRAGTGPRSAVVSATPRR